MALRGINFFRQGYASGISSLCQKVAATTISQPPTSALMPASVCVTQVRYKRRYKRRHSLPPFWLPKTTRTLYPENLSPDNVGFVREAVEQRYSSPLKVEAWERGEWSPMSKRCGVIARKIGIYPMWTKEGRRLLTTLLQVTDNHVIKYIPPEEFTEFRPKQRRRTVGALIVGADSIDPTTVTKEHFTLFQDSGLLPKKKMSKFIITPDAKLPPGTPLYATHFQPGNYVDVRGITIDRGFQGVMKRWGFKGMPASHGVTKSHRRGGTIGSGAGRAIVLPGTKMPGHMGREKRILRGLKVWRVNTRHNVLWVQGPAIPGSTGSYVTIYDTILPTPQYRYTADNHPPFPTFYQDEEEVEEELYDDKLHVFSQASINFAEN